MPEVVVENIKSGAIGRLTVPDSIPVAELNEMLAREGARLVPSTSIRVEAEDGSAVDYPYPANMPVQDVMKDLAEKGWTLANEGRRGTNVPRGPIGGNTTARGEAVDIDMEGLSAGAEEMLRDVANAAIRPFTDPVEYARRIVKQTVEKKNEERALGDRLGNLEGASSYTAYPNAARSVPRAAAESAVEYAFTRNVRGALGRIARGAFTAGAFETLDQSDRSFIEALGTGGAQAFGIGAAMTAAGELPHGMKRWLGKALNDTLEARGIALRPDAHPFHLDEPDPDVGGRPPSEVAGIPLAPYQALNSAPLARMSSAATASPGGPREQFENAQAQSVLGLFSDLRDRYLPANLLPSGMLDRSAGTVAVRTAGRRYEQFMEDTMGQVRGRFTRALWPAIARANARTSESGIITGGQALLPASNYLRTVRDIIRQAEESGVSPDQLVPLQNDIARIERDGGWTVGGFQNRMMIEGRRAYGDRGASGSWTDLHQSFEPRVIYQAMQRDLDTAIAVADEPLVQVGGRGAPNRQAYSGPGREYGGRSEVRPEGYGSAEANLEAWRNSGQPGLPGAPQGPAEPSTPGASTPPRNPMGLSDPIHDPYEAAYAALDEAALARLRGTRDTRAIATALRGARDGFANDMEAVREVNESALSRLFGEDMKGATQDVYRDRYFALKPDQQVEIMRFLDKSIPQAANYLRGAFFASIIDEAKAARRVTSGSRDLVDVGVFARRLGSLQRGQMEALLPAGMSAEGRQRVLAGMLTLETIGKAPDISLIGNETGFIPRMKSASINAVLQNFGFLSSFAAGELAPAALERSIFREEGIRGWMRLGQARPGSSAFMSALASIADQAWLAERDVEEIKQRAEEAARQEAERVQKFNALAPMGAPQ